MPGRRWFVCAQVLVAALVCAAGLFRPAYNWDLFAYMGLAAERPGSTDAEIHRAVYEEARTRMPPEKFSQAVDDGGFKSLMSRRPDLFREQFGWYRERVLFVALARAFHAAGLPLMSSVQLLSVLSFFGLNVLFGFWVMKYAPAPAAALIGAAQALNFADVARLATPDALYALAVLLALYFLIEREQPYACSLLLLASLFIRNDGVLLAVAVLFYSSCLAPKRSRLSAAPAAAQAIGFGAAALILSRMGGHYGWTALFYNSFFGGVADPAHFTGTVSPGAYVRVLALGLASIPASGVLAFVIIGAIACYASRRSEKFSPRLYFGLPACLIAAAAARFCLYPLAEQRTLLPLCYMLIVLSVRMLSSPQETGAREAAGAST